MVNTDKKRIKRKAESKISHRHTQTHADIKKGSRLKDRRWAVGKMRRCVKDGRGKEGRWEGEKIEGGMLGG